MSVVGAEWRRLFARRFTRIMLALVVVLLGAVAIGVAVNHHKITAADRAAAQQQVNEDQQQMSTQLAECVREQSDPNAQGDYKQLPPGATCDQMFAPPQLDWFLPSQWVLTDQARSMLIVFGGLLALFGFAVGASYVGAEWSSGGMTNLLLWRPRRVPLLAAKLGTLLLGVGVAGVALLIAWAGMLSAIAATRGYFGHVTTGFVESIALSGGRGIALALAAAALGFAIAIVGRSTVAALGVAIAYVIVVEAAGHLVFDNVLHIKRPERFFLSSYAYAWLTKKISFDTSGACTVTPGGGQQCSLSEWTIGMTHAAVILGVVLAVLVGWAFLAFRRRDVT
jgi:ABC-type transport system involved in multi-copper enzyme maturation permease subunit